MQEIAEDATSPEIREHAASPDGMDKRRRFSVILPFSVSSVKWQNENGRQKDLHDPSS